MTSQLCRWWVLDEARKNTVGIGNRKRLEPGKDGASLAVFRFQSSASFALTMSISAGTYTMTEPDTLKQLIEDDALATVLSKKSSAQHAGKVYPWTSLPLSSRRQAGLD
ncbi:hypothetical protein N8198_03210 [Gammaproteobacteria bacterium]|nr:hypothetical protein [Gammaproteobacteria bacterium]